MAFQRLVDELREATGALRVTLRLDTPGEVYPIVAESLAPGARSLAGDTSIDLRKAATYEYLERTLQPLVQNDFVDVAEPPPRELVEGFGVRSQMLAPVVKDGRLVGIVSVHASEPRDWNGEEIAAATRTAEQVAAEL